MSDARTGAADDLADDDAADDLADDDVADDDVADDDVADDDARGPAGVDDETEPPLRVDSLHKRFGGIVAVDDATFEIEAGTLTGLIGPNGAGKSTTFNCITGAIEPDGGTVHFQGEDVTGLRPDQVARRGLVRTFQIARTLDEMTVLENLMLSPSGQLGERIWPSITPGVRGRVVAQEVELRERVWEMLELFEIDHLAEEQAGNLSGGQQKLLELSRALMTDPDMLLLDEPLAGVNPTLEEKLLDRIHTLREGGLTFLLVEHDMDVIMENCERVIVMHQGTILADGEPDDVRSDERVIDAYLGEDI